jgi:hypothetical protein
MRWLVPALVATLVIAGEGHAQKTAFKQRDLPIMMAPPPGMQAIIDSIKPMFSAVMGGMYGGIIEYLAQPETAAKLATFAKNYFDELRKRGFSREEALMLVQGVGIPGPTGR